jgi:hypothetical protein
VTCNPGGITATGAASPVRVTGLANGTAYGCSVTATNAVGTGPASSIASVTPAQITLFSAPSATGTGTITVLLSGGGAGCGFTYARFIPVTGDPASPPGGAPPGVSFPQGLFDFALGGCTPASTVTLTISYPTALPRGSVYWKYGPTATKPTPDWYVVPATISTSDITLRISDGGLGDDDLAANGTIVDPGGPGIGTAGPTIPLLDPWMLALLGSILVLLGMRRLR